jgi:hypothetical protein
MKKEDLKAYGQARGIWRKSSLNGRSEQIKVEAPTTSQVQQSQSYVSEQVLASQAAQSQSVSYPAGVSIADYYGITKAQASERLAESIGLQCSLEEEMEKNHQYVLITDLEDAHKVLHNLWFESGRDVAALAASINTAKSWFNHTDPMFNASSIAKQFGDMGIKADLVESKGKTFVAFSGTDKNGKALKHAFVNGTRINMNGKKYPLNSFKSIQAGFSPKSRAANFKGAGVLTFVVSASIATSDLVFKDDYHLVNWFGNVGADMFKALLQYGAGEAALFAAVAMTGSLLVGGVVCAFAYLAIEFMWGKYNISNSIVMELENAVEN